MLEEEEKVNQSNTNLYSIPVIFSTSYNIRGHIAMIISFLFFIGIAMVPFEGVEGILIRIFSFLFGLIILYVWLNVGVIKNSYFELTAEKITSKYLFYAKKEVKWVDIYEIQQFKVKANPYIGILSNEKAASRNSSLFSALFKIQFSLVISLVNYSTVDSNKLYSTIINQYHKKQPPHEDNNMNANADRNVDHNIDSNVDRNINSNNLNSNNLNSNMNMNNNSIYNTNNHLGNLTYNNTQKISPVSQFFLALMTSLISGILYGICLAQFKIDFIIIPIIALGLILFIYFGKDFKNNPGIITRLLIGFFSALQFYVGIISHFYMLNASHAKPSRLLAMFLWLINNMTTNPGMYHKYFINGFVFFLIGALFGIQSIKRHRFNQY